METKKKKTKITIQAVLEATFVFETLKSSSPEEAGTDLTCVSDPAQVVQDVVKRWVGLLTCLGELAVRLTG